MTDETTEPVQPVEGQGGGESEGGSPWEHYLDRFTPETRETAAAVLKEQEANANRRFQQDAEYRKNWEPYEQLRDNLGSPEDVQSLLQFRDLAANDPQAIQQWYQQYADANGLTPQQVAEQQAQQEPADFFAPDSEQVGKLLDEKLGPLQQQVEQFNQWRQEQEYNSRLTEAQQLIESQLGSLKREHSDVFEMKDGQGNSIAEQAIARFANEYAESDPENAIPRAFADYQSWLGVAQRSALQQKAGDPLPAEGGGVANAAPDQPQSFADANPQAKEMVRTIMQRAIS